MDIEKFIDFFMARSANQEPIIYENYGNVVSVFSGSGNIGGSVIKIDFDDMGRLAVRGFNSVAIIGCGHAVSKTEDIGGICKICGRLCCNRRGCIQTCDILGITCCKKHYSIIDGIVVSTKAQKGMWKSKAKKLARRKGILSNEFKQLPEKV
jgi:hypothetical protein